MHVPTLVRAVLAAFVLLLSLPSLAENGPVNLNQASAAEIAAVMKGVGEKKAQAIVAYRSQFGPFSTVDELVKVKGIGPGTVDKNRDRLTVESTLQASPELSQVKP